ncbi:MAG: GNAT family N-acetyltransferase [Chitinophagaceae bacterium]|nr:GNAT family N-acetyltransferase [Chitinophagaceae bacterium]
MPVIIKTNRLLLRTFEPGEGALIYRLNEDPEVTRYTGDPVRDIVHGEEVLQQVILPQYIRYGYGRWAVELTETNEFIGWCGLKYRPERKETDLGYRFFQTAWGRGYATEAAQASVRFGLEVAGLQRIVGRAMPGNRASVRVLEKCGMCYIGEEIVDEHPALTYEICAK